MEKIFKGRQCISHVFSFFQYCLPLIKEGAQFIKNLRTELLGKFVMIFRRHDKTQFASKTKFVI